MAKFSGGLLFGDQYIQIATYLPTKNIFGFGEHVHKKIKVSNLVVLVSISWKVFVAGNDEPEIQFHCRQ